MEGSVDRFNRIVNSVARQNLGATQREIPFNGGKLTIIYIKQLTDIAMLSENVIRPLINYCARAKEISAERAQNILYAADCTVSKNQDTIADTILLGRTVILFSTDQRYLVVNLTKVEHRGVNEPEIEFSLRGSKDCFNESLDVNISLIRHRIKDNMLRIRMLEAGKRTKTRVAVIYIEDIANDTAVTEIIKRIEAIDVDGIIDSGEVQEFLLNKKTNLYPQMGLVERSDYACRMLLSGRVVTLVDGSVLGLSAPATLSQFFYSCDDLYENKYFGAFMRIIRYVSFFITLTASSFYVALTSFHTSALPSDYTILLAEMTAKVPFPAVIGAFLLEFLMETIRESLLRVPRRIGSAIAIVGAIVIGQAAISAGLFSPFLLLIVSTSLMTSFVMPDYSIINPFRIMKFLLLIFTGIFGFYGFTIIMCMILSDLVSINSFGVPYMATIAPFNRYDFLHILAGSKTVLPFRTKFMRTKDKKLK